MARHSLPIEVQKLKGASRENPGRIPANVPKSTMPLGDCPPDLDSDERAVWEDIVASAPAGVFTRPDRWLLKIACRLQVDLDRTPTKEIGTSRIAALTALMARFGFTPSDRRRLGTDEPPAGS